VRPKLTYREPTKRRSPCWQQRGLAQHVLHVSQAAQHVVSLHVPQLQLGWHCWVNVESSVLTGKALPNVDTEGCDCVVLLWLCRCSCGPLLVLLRLSVMTRWLRCASHQV
jgi:hypothetical protein